MDWRVCWRLLSVIIRAVIHLGIAGITSMVRDQMVAAGACWNTVCLVSIEMHWNTLNSEVLFTLKAFHSAGVTWVPSPLLSPAASRPAHSDPSVTLASTWLIWRFVSPSASRAVLWQKCSGSRYIYLILLMVLVKLMGDWGGESQISDWSVQRDLKKTA